MHRYPLAQLERRGNGVGPGVLLDEPAAHPYTDTVDHTLDRSRAEPATDDARVAVGEHDAEAGIGQMQGDLVEDRSRCAHQAATPVDVGDRQPVDRLCRVEAVELGAPPRLRDLRPRGLRAPPVVRDVGRHRHCSPPVSGRFAALSGAGPGMSTPPFGGNLQGAPPLVPARSVSL